MSVVKPLSESDKAFQQRMLEGVARTFALTIPQLPPALADVVANAYLLCRIADTLEDETAVRAVEKPALAKSLSMPWPGAPRRSSSLAAFIRGWALTACPLKRN